MGLFLEEAAEQLQVLERETIRLEQEPSSERLQALFRAAHTIKGSARAMGFERLGNLTHEMESLLDQLRSGRLGVTTEIADTLLICLDVLMEMHQRITEGQGDNVDTTRLIDHIRSHLRPGAEDGPPPQRVTVVLAEDCAMKSVRAFMALAAAEEMGEIVATHPPREALDAEQFGSEFSMVLRTEHPPEDIRQRVESIGEVVSVTVGDERPETPSGPDPPGRAPAPPTTVPPQSRRPVDAGQTVRIDVSRLDAMLDLVGELVTERARIAQIGASLTAEYDFNQRLQGLAEATGRLARVTGDLQDQIMRARMLPIEVALNRLPRVARDLARKTGKKVELRLEGGGAEIDRSVIEAVVDPLIHLVRNCIDHGIEPPPVRAARGKPETGHMRVSAHRQEHHIVVEVTDDGAGIDVDGLKTRAVAQGHLTSEEAERMGRREALDLVFRSGLTTTAEVTEFSGRGVGMDIVRSNMEKLGGLVEVESEWGHGTRFTLHLPPTLAIMRGLLVNISGTVFVAPIGSVLETLRIEPSRVHRAASRDVIDLRGRALPLVWGCEVFWGRSRQVPADGHLPVVVLGLAEQRLGLVVDRLLGERQVVVKSLDRFLGDVRGVSGSTVLGDGAVALIMDLACTARKAREN